MSIFSVISDIFKPAAELVDNLTTSDEERLTLRNELARAEHEFVAKTLEYESKLIESQASIIKAEAEGQSWLQRNWRPVLMLTIIAIIGNNYLLAPYINSIFGAGTAPMLELPEQLWTLMTLGLSGYVAGRTAEKIAPAVLQAFQGRGNG